MWVVTFIIIKNFANWLKEQKEEINCVGTKGNHIFPVSMSGFSQLHQKVQLF